MTPPLNSVPSRSNYERQDLERRKAFEAGETLPAYTNIVVDEDNFGGGIDVYAFPVIMATAATALAVTYGLIVVNLFPQMLDDHFAATCAGLAAMIAFPLAIVASIRERRKWRSYKALRSVASLDPLTGLMNRRSFSVSLDEELRRMSRTGQAAAVILFDLDHFKQLNDQYGHHVGDDVLTEIASIAYSELRNPFDRLARWGGEEFIILLHDMTEETARSVCERLRAKIETMDDDRDLNVTASFGGSLLRPSQPFSEALHKADIALYDAKSNGRNRVTFTRCIDLAA